MTQTPMNCLQEADRRCWNLALLCIPLAVLIQLPLNAEESKSLRHSSVVLAIQAAEPAVVNIEGSKPAAKANQIAAGDAPQVNGMGAGVIIDDRGYILTNQHVVQDVKRIDVTLHDGSQHTGRMVARDSATDLAMIKIDAQSPLPVMR